MLKILIYGFLTFNVKNNKNNRTICQYCLNQSVEDIFYKFYFQCNKE